MSKKGRIASRVLGDRLWDADGAVWTGVLGSWPDDAEVEHLLHAGVPVIVHGFDRPFRTIPNEETNAWWQRVRLHFSVPGSGRGADPDGEGLTYAAQVWSREGRRLLGFVEYC